MTMSHVTTHIKPHVSHSCSNSVWLKIEQKNLFSCPNVLIEKGCKGRNITLRQLGPEVDGPFTSRYTAVLAHSKN